MPASGGTFRPSASDGWTGCTTPHRLAQAGSSRPPQNRMIELDLEGHLLEVVRGQFERGLGKIDPVVVPRFRTECSLHLTRVATSNIEKGKGSTEGPVEGVGRIFPTALWERQSASTSF